MTTELLVASLQLSMPELILAVGSMVLLMIGVYSGKKSSNLVTGLAVALLIIAGLWMVLVHCSSMEKSFPGRSLYNPPASLH